MNFVPEDIQKYCLAHTDVPTKLCEELQTFTVENVPYAQMLSGPLVGGFLGLLISMLGARRVIEVGTFTGYSALAMAEKLPDGGELITLDRNPDTQAIGKRFWDRSPHGVKIRALAGDANALLDTLPGPFDFAFIDADKAGYLGYLQKILPKLSANALVVADNCLWSGRVLEKNPDADTTAIQRFNRWAIENESLQTVLVPIRDGLMLIRRR